MKDEKQQMLEAFEKELWEDDLLKDMPQTLIGKDDEEEFDAILAKILEDVGTEKEPAFEDPDKLHYSDEPFTYCNYSNGYGSDNPEADAYATDENEYADEDSQEDKEAVKSEDRWLITLMGVASALCVGIIGVMVYWMEVFLK